MGWTYLGCWCGDHVGVAVKCCMGGGRAGWTRRAIAKESKVFATPRAGLQE
jgi:hypothetical protein